MPYNRHTTPQFPPLMREKIAAFDRLLQTFASFTYVEQMHGERRFPRVPVSATVRYLHALWVCNCKDTDEARCESYQRSLGVHDEVLVASG